VKNNQNGFGLVGLLAVFIVLSLVGVVGWWTYTKNLQNQQQQSNASLTSDAALKVTSSNGPSQAEVRHTVNPANKQSVALYPNIYYFLTTDAGQTYYGHAQKINNEYIKLYDVAYYSAASNASTLVALGGELHGPESIMYLHLPHVQAFDQLTPASSNYTQVTDYYKANAPYTGTDAYPSASIQHYLKSAQLQAFFFSDGQIYFAKSSSLSGKFLAQVQNVYTLYGSSQVSLKKVPAADAAKYTGGDIIFWENLRTDGKVSKAITDFERQQ
jgi:membrane-bound inhibitor of C-type lysozyme/type II secretory pathway pseudopilin PulG